MSNQYDNSEGINEGKTKIELESVSTHQHKEDIRFKRRDWKSKALSDVVWGVLQKECTREELMTMHLIQNWEKIVQELSTISRPEKLNLQQELLVVRVKPGQVMIMQYQHERIRDCVNMFFGREYIMKVLMKSELS